MTTGALALAIGLFCTSAIAEDTAPPANAAPDVAPAAAATPLDAAWDAAGKAAIRGPGSTTIMDQATIAIPEGYAFVPVKEAAALMTLMGNRTGDAFAGMMAPLGEGGWFATVDYISSGHIHDDDAKDWNADDLLSNLKEGTEEGNKFREQQGVKPIEITGWIQRPAYDAANHRLVWSIELKDKGTQPAREDITVNYNTYVLGREGYVSMNVVASAARIEALKPVAQSLLGGIAFNEGRRYADFKPDTDRVAEYGLAALIGGVAAKKLGLFAMLGVAIAKFWKLAIVAIAGLGVGFKKFFKRKDAPPATPA